MAGSALGAGDSGEPKRQRAGTFYSGEASQMQVNKKIHTVPEALPPAGGAVIL